MRIDREILHNSYLLILSNEPDPALASLREALQRAGRSGRPNIWVDCSHMDELEDQALTLVMQEASRLRQIGVQVVLCHPPASCRLPAHTGLPEDQLLIAASLLDAEACTRWTN
ncbi:hypothetical protein [Hymenobacter sp. BT730]|uniref:hypothetical protein n=1 Tax=Hymenobacter sp. BT730 TaxID=3063332 RepID=UPI0026DF3074|nr:hypothetical protein [Hymenobacter sp. BT730]